MSEKCRQKGARNEGCGNDAKYSFTWPGQPPSFICAFHSTHLLRVSDAMGLHIQLRPLEDRTLVSVK